MRRRMGHFQKEADEAANLWQDHFKTLNRDNIYEKIVRYMEPFKNLHHQQAQLNAQQDLLSQSINRTHDRLMQKMADDAAINTQLLQQMNTLNTLLEKATAKGPVGRMMEKVFGGATPPRKS
jgi:DNA repair exonuclease SbcCD ATPase subunit